MPMCACTKDIHVHVWLLVCVSVCVHVRMCVHMSAVCERSAGALATSENDNR